MSVARNTEISAQSPDSFDAAIREGLARATSTLRGVTNVWIADQELLISNNEITQYRVRMKITFELEG
jgi:flavin-binding protein dodecin